MRVTITNRTEEIDFECNSDFQKRTIQNARNLLMTMMGEVPFDRNRGFDVSLFDQPAQVIKNDLLREIDRLLTWEPDAKAVSADYVLDTDGTVLISCVIEIPDER